MKSLLAGFCLCVCLGAFALPAQAQSSRLYFAGYMGLQSNFETEFRESSRLRSGDMEYDNTVSFAGALGVRVDHQWRTEAELSYRKIDVASIDLTGGGRLQGGGSIGSWIALANVYYDFDMDWRDIVPYVTGGAGFAWHDGSLNGGSGLPAATGNAFGLAWQFGGGMKYRVEDDMAFNVGYRYLGTTSMEIDGYDIDYGAHEFRLGIEYDIPVKK